MKAYVLAATLLFGVALSAKSDPVTFSFSGTDYGGPSYAWGGTNYLNIAQGQSVSGAFTIDTTGAVDNLAGDPKVAQFSNVVTSFRDLMIKVYPGGE